MPATLGAQDILSTSYFCADNAGIAAMAAAAQERLSAQQAASGAAKPAAAVAADEPVVAVVGCGPVGLLTVISERQSTACPAAAVPPAG